MKTALDVVSDPLFADLKSHVIQKTGLVYFRDKDADLGMRMLRRLTVTGDESCGAYLERLRGSGSIEEFDALVVELTIGETYFFRHQEQFDALRARVIPDLIHRNRDQRRLRVWCAGCSIGAEPFSIAILLTEHFGHELRGWDVRVIGTDLNRDFLTRAREARYDEWSFRTTTPELRERHFIPQNKSWVVKPAIRAMVDFQHHNLLASLPPVGGPFDLIFCRNVMIYFDWATVAELMPKFEDGLVDGGWLVIGHAEQPHGATRLTSVQLPNVTVYQRGDVSSVPSAIVPITFPVEPPTPPPAPAQAIGPADIMSLRLLADRGQFREALDRCTNLIVANPADPRPYFYRALVNEQLGRASEIGPDLERAIELDQTFVMAHYLFALHQRHRRDQRLAARSFHRALYLLDRLPTAATLPEADQMTVAELKLIIARYLEAA